MVEEEKEDYGEEGGGGRERHLVRRPSEGGHSKDRSSGFKQVEKYSGEPKYLCCSTFAYDTM